MGYRYLETDVHATRDGQVVAFHDTVLDRVSDCRGAIATLPYDAVREARIGGAEPIPLLSDLFEEFPDTRINIDIKADDALAPTVREVLRHNATERVCIGSFSERRLRAARAALGPRRGDRRRARSARRLLRFTPAALSRMLHTPAPVLQLPALHRLRGPHRHPGDARAWCAAPTTSASTCTCGSTRGRARTPTRCTGCSTSAPTASSPTTSTCCATCSPNAGIPSSRPADAVATRG